jgi:hypothetical protein
MASAFEACIRTSGPAFHQWRIRIAGVAADG